MSTGTFELCKKIINRLFKLMREKDETGVLTIKIQLGALCSFAKMIDNLPKGELDYTCIDGFDLITNLQKISKDLGNLQKISKDLGSDESPEKAFRELQRICQTIWLLWLMSILPDQEESLKKNYLGMQRCIIGTRPAWQNVGGCVTYGVVMLSTDLESANFTADFFPVSDTDQAGIENLLLTSPGVSPSLQLVACNNATDSELGVDLEIELGYTGADASVESWAVTKHEQMLRQYLERNGDEVATNQEKVRADEPAQVQKRLEGKLQKAEAATKDALGKVHTLTAQLEQAQQAAASSNADNATLTAQLDEAQQAEDILQRQLQEAHQVAASSTADNATLKAQLDEAQQAAASSTADNATLKAQLQEAATKAAKEEATQLKAAAAQAVIDRAEDDAARAEIDAAQIKEAAEQEAAQIKEAAEQEAAQIEEAANANAAQIEEAVQIEEAANAKAEAVQIKEAAEQEAAQIKEAANANAAQIEEAANANAAQIEEAANANAAQIEEAANANAAQIEEAANANAAQIEEAVQIEEAANAKAEAVQIKEADKKVAKRKPDDARFDGNISSSLFARAVQNSKQCAQSRVPLGGKSKRQRS